MVLSTAFGLNLATVLIDLVLKPGYTIATLFCYFQAFVQLADFVIYLREDKVNGFAAVFSGPLKLPYPLM